MHKTKWLQELLSAIFDGFDMPMQGLLCTANSSISPKRVTLIGSIVFTTVEVDGKTTLGGGSTAPTEEMDESVWKSRKKSCRTVKFNSPLIPKKKTKQKHKNIKIEKKSNALYVALSIFTYFTKYGNTLFINVKLLGVHISNNVNFDCYVVKLRKPIRISMP